MKARSILVVAAVASLMLVSILAANAAAPWAEKPAKDAPAANGDWPMYGHDPSRTAYNPAETIITPANVRNLVARWQVNIGEGAAPAYSAPSVANGKVYVAS